MGRTAFLGRQAIVDQLLQIKQADKLGQPFLLTGPEGSGKENTALEFARLINCAEPATCGPSNLCESCVKALSFQHPDIRWIGPAPAAIKESEVRDLFEAKMEHPFHQAPFTATSQISIGDPEHPGPLSIRSIIHFLRRRAFQSPFKVAIVADGQRMNQAAANAFLKTLEEPPPQTVIFMLTVGTEGMLPTIVSRCQKVRFDPWPETELQAILESLTSADSTTIDQACRVSDGNARRALALLKPEAGLLMSWSSQIFQWIHERNRAMTAIAADEIHRGLMGHAILPAGVTAKSVEAKETAARRGRAIQLCELLNLHYSDTIGNLEAGDQWNPRLPAANGIIVQTAPVRQTNTLLRDLDLIDVARQDIDRNINIGLAMAVMFEGLIEHVEKDQRQ